MSNPTWSPISQSAYLKNQRHWTKSRSADISRNSSALTAGRWPQSLLNAWVAESGNHFPEQPGYPGGSLYSGTVLSKESLSNKFVPLCPGAFDGLSSRYFFCGFGSKQVASF